MQRGTCPRWCSVEKFEFQEDFQRLSIFISRHGQELGFNATPWLLCVEPTSPLFVWRGVAVAAKPPWYGADCGSQPVVLGTWRPVYHI